MTAQDPLTGIEAQLLSRSRSYNEDLWPGTAARWLHVDGTEPHTEIEALAELEEKGYLQVTHQATRDTWYELTPLGLDYFRAAWPNRRN